MDINDAIKKQSRKVHSMIRILHVIGSMGRGGSETMIMNLYRKINREKIQFDFMVHTEKKFDYDDEIQALGGKIYRVPKFNGRNFSEYKKSWESFFNKHREHKIVHGHIGSSAAIYLKIAKKHGRFAIAHSHNTRDNSKSVRSYLWRVYSFPTRYVADYFFACSKQAGIDRYGKKAIGNNFTVLNNAIDSALYRYSPDVRRSKRIELNIENSFVIGHVGRFEYQKNHEFLVDAFYEIHKRKDNAVLMLIGDGTLKPDITRQVSELGISDSVLFLGVRDDVPDLMQAMDVFVFPSRYEGLGIVAIEAQAAGLHTVCSDVLPAEAAVTKLLEPCSLEKGSNFWAKTILKYSSGYDRSDMKEEICEAGYDIYQTVRWLETFYEEHST